ncbi:MAG: TatD family hydrolase [Planctomycetia bacterium]|nr:TatD family hydrolase [Planctomycetia bacterium]
MSEDFLELVDTHAHLDMDSYDEDRLEVIERCKEGIFPNLPGKRETDLPFSCRMKAIICPGITLETSRNGIEVCRKSQILYPAVGIHPNYAKDVSDSEWNFIRELAGLPEVVGIGETGLDLYWDYAPLEKQIENLYKHLEIARSAQKPILIHCREAEKELLPILRDFCKWDPNQKGPALKGIIHSFSADPETALECIDLGFYISFSGSVSYTNKKFAPVWEAARIVPDDRLLLETDSPFLVPHPFRGKLERNEPLMSFFAAKRLAELRSVSLEEITRLTADNAFRLFELKGKNR